MGSLDTLDGQKYALPIIDLAAFTDDKSDDEKQLAAKALVEACRSVGFAYIKNHGLPKDDLNRAFEISRKFFALPMSDKMKAPHPAEPTHHKGYSPPGLSKTSNSLATGDDIRDGEVATKLREIKDVTETYEIGSEDNKEFPNIWLPDEVLPEWRPFMQRFYRTCWETSAKVILQALAVGLGIEEALLLDPHDDGRHNQLRLAHYPPWPAKDIEDGKAIRLGAHSDWSTITILFQDDCGGLQVESSTQPGTFIDVDPVPDTLVLNVGDLLMRWSNDYLKSTQHRVQLPPFQDRFEGKERLTRARYSIPYFVAANPDILIKCLSSSDLGEPKYEPITYRDYSAMRFKMSY